MTPRQIKPEGVRVGDRVRAEFNGGAAEGVVEGIDMTWPESIRLTWSACWLPNDDLTLTLLDRPLPPLPTARGTVIRDRTSGVIYVRTDDGGGRWAAWGSDWASTAFTPTRADYDVLVPEQDPS